MQKHEDSSRISVLAMLKFSPIKHNTYSNHRLTLIPPTERYVGYSLHIMLHLAMLELLTRDTLIANNLLPQVLDKIKVQWASYLLLSLALKTSTIANKVTVLLATSWAYSNTKCCNLSLQRSHKECVPSCGICNRDCNSPMTNMTF